MAEFLTEPALSQAKAALRIAAVALFVVAVPLFLVSTNVRLIVNWPWLYSNGFDKYDIPSRTGIERSELISAGEQIRDYFNNDDELIDVRDLRRRDPAEPVQQPRDTAHEGREGPRTGRLHRPGADRPVHRRRSSSPGWRSDGAPARAGSPGTCSTGAS